MQRRKSNNSLWFGCKCMLIFIILLFTFLLLLFVVKETVYAVFCFILVIFNLISLLFLLNLDFLALLILLIYIGAIVVLFLFVSMLLGIQVSSDTQPNVVISSGICLVFVLLGLVKLGLLSLNGVLPENSCLSTVAPIVKENLVLFSINNFSFYLYTIYAPVLILSAFLLLIALVGSVLLTMQTSK